MAVNGVLNSAAQSAPAPPKAKNELSMQTFIQLLTVQLTNQDPLEPMKNTDFFAQLAQLGQVQGIDQLNKNADVQKAQSLMGQTVTAFDPNGTPGTNQLVTGVASKLAIKNGVYWLSLTQANGGNVDVQMANIQDVQPTPDLLQANAMIGRSIAGTAQVTVGGTQQSKTVFGTVSSVGVANGQIQLDVKTTDYGLVTVPFSTVTNIG